MRPTMILACLLVSACASTPPRPEILTARPRVKPLECLTPAEIGACRLPDWFDRASLADQAALILNCAVVNGAAALEAERKRACLADWIEAAP